MTAADETGKPVSIFCLMPSRAGNAAQVRAVRAGLLAPAAATRAEVGRLNYDVCEVAPPATPVS